jgi:hypothetical protein
MEDELGDAWKAAFNDKPSDFVGIAMGEFQS